MLELGLVLVLAAVNPHARSPAPTAEVGSAIVGIVTPDEVLLFTDSARSTIAPVAGANSQLVDTKTTKLWKTGRLIWAQAGLQAMTIHSKSFDFDDPARLLLTANGPFNPEKFRKAWLPEVETPLTEAYNENVAGFTNLVNNGANGVEIVVGWFDASSTPHLSRIRVVISISPTGGLELEDICTEIHSSEARNGKFMLAAKAANIAPELRADTERHSQLEALVEQGRYAEAAKLIIDYAAERFTEVGVPIQEADLKRADLN
jgi:hypothetical protein